MTFGVCTTVDMAPVLAQAGFDYIELNVQRDLCPEEDLNTFQPLRDSIKAADLPCSVANCFVPGHLKLVGPDVSLDALQSYVSTAFERAADVKIDTIVFGSGGARRIPEGVSREKAYEQLLAFGRLIAPIAGTYGVTVVVEPLNSSECNVFNSVSECARYVRDLNHPNIQLLADAYHVSRDNENPHDMVPQANILRHIHIATYESRLAPGLEPCDFSAFFDALHQAEYTGRVSIEGGWKDMARDARGALEVLKSFNHPPA